MSVSALLASLVDLAEKKRFLDYQYTAVSSGFAFAQSLQLSWFFFYHHQLLQFLVPRFPASQHRSFVEVGRRFCAKIELHFSLYFVQGHWSPFYATDQYLHRKKSVVLNQPFCIVFFDGKESCGFSKHLHKSSDTDRYKGFLFTARVSHIKMCTVNSYFGQQPEAQNTKCFIVHVHSASYMVPSY